MKVAATGLAGMAAVLAVTLMGGTPTASAALVNTGTSANLKAIESKPASSKARQKALAKCRKIRLAKKRKACIKRVKRRFGTVRPKPPVNPAGPTVEVQVLDKYFMPDQLELPRFGSVRWIWGIDNSEPHGITLLSGPKGVSPLDFKTPLAPSRFYSFQRNFKVPGRYRLVCSMHYTMRMTVEVGS